MLGAFFWQRERAGEGHLVMPEGHFFLLVWEGWLRFLRPFIAFVFVLSLDAAQLQRRRHAVLLKGTHYGLFFGIVATTIFDGAIARLNEQFVIVHHYLAAGYAFHFLVG